MTPRLSFSEPSEPEGVLWDMRIVLLIALSFFSLFACNIDKGKRVDAEHRVYKSNDASKLFFRNMRASYYDKTTLEAAKLDVYRIRTRNLSDDFPVINLALVNNWLQDEAYIIVEPNGFFSVGDTIRVHWMEEEGKQDISFVFGNKDMHTIFADKVYDNLLNARTMYISKGEQEWPLFPSNKERESFRITMLDFYRLVQRL